MVKQWRLLFIIFLSQFIHPSNAFYQSNVTCDSQIIGQTHGPSDIDYYLFINDNSNSTIFIDLCPTPNATNFDTILNIYDEQLDLLDTNDTGNGCNNKQSQIIFQPLNSDNFIIGVTGSNSEYGQYQMDITCMRSNTTSTTPNSTDYYTTIQPTSAPSSSTPIFAVDIKDFIDCGELIIDSTENDNPHYYVLHNKYENNHIIIDLCDSEYDTRTILYTHDMTELKENDDGDKSTECGPGSLESYIDAGELSSDFYIIEVNGYELETGTYHLIITCSITSSPTQVTTAPSPAPSGVTSSPTTAEPSISPTNQPTQSPTDQTVSPSSAPTGVTSAPTTASPTKTPATLIFYDNMKYDTEWEISSSYHVEEKSISTRCPIEPDNDCLRINGYATGGCYIKRSVPNLDLFNYYQLKFVVTLSNMETADYCRVKYSWDDVTYFELNSYQGQGGSVYVNIMDQSFIFPADNNATTLYIMFENEGNHASGSDYCYIDDVWLYGSPVEIDLEINHNFYDIIESHIGCKDIIQGETNSGRISHYYQYNNTMNDTMIIVNACGESEFHLNIFVAVWDQYGRRIATARDPCGYIRSGGDPDGFYIPLSSEGIIIIQVYGYNNAYGEYTLEVICVEGSIGCGDRISSSTSNDYVSHYYIFENPVMDNNITVNLCGSDFDSRLYMYDYQYSDVNPDYSECEDIWEQIASVFSYIADIGVYVIEVTGYEEGGILSEEYAIGTYHLQLTCSIMSNITLSAPSETTTAAPSPPTS